MLNRIPLEIGLPVFDYAYVGTYCTPHGLVLDLREYVKAGDDASKLRVAVMVRQAAGVRIWSKTCWVPDLSDPLGKAYVRAWRDFNEG